MRVWGGEWGEGKRKDNERGGGEGEGEGGCEKRGWGRGGKLVVNSDCLVVVGGKGKGGKGEGGGERKKKRFPLISLVRIWKGKCECVVDEGKGCSSLILHLLTFEKKVFF